MLNYFFSPKFLKNSFFLFFFIIISTIFFIVSISNVIASENESCFLSSKEKNEGNTKCFFQCSNKVKFITFDNVKLCPEKIIINYSKNNLSKVLKIKPYFNFGFSSLGGSNFGVTLDIK